MSGEAWDKWFWSDWLADRGLRLCSLAARGLWMDMLAIMADAEGYLVIAGKPLATDALARLVGAGAGEVETYLLELEAHAVFSRARGRVIYCRKMVRTRNKQRSGRETGHFALAASPGDKRRNAAIPPGRSGIPETRDQKPEVETTPSAPPLPAEAVGATVVPFSRERAGVPEDDWPSGDARTLLRTLAAAVGHPLLRPEDDVTARLHRSAASFLPRWRGAGCSWEADVVPVAQARCAETSEPIHTLKFFDWAVMNARTERTAPHHSATTGDRHDKLARNDENLQRSRVGLDRIAAHFGDAGSGRIRDD